MCNPDQTSFLQSNLVGLVTIIVAAVFVVWQTLYTVWKQKQTALAEQRYDIFLKIDALTHYYQQKGSGQTPTIPLIPTKREIMRLLVRPTGMPQHEIQNLLSLLEATPDDYTKETWELVQGELNRLIGLLNPSVLRAGEIVGMKT